MPQLPIRHFITKFSPGVRLGDGISSLIYNMKFKM